MAYKRKTVDCWDVQGDYGYGDGFEGFRLRSVAPDYFEIGCHKIQFSELDAVAKATGFSAFHYTMKEEG